MPATHSAPARTPGQRRRPRAKYGLDRVSLDEVEHFKLTRDFCTDPATFVQSALDEGE
jgi:hypothetical protein